MLSISQLVLAQLFVNRIEKLLADQRWHRNIDPFILRHVVRRIALPWLGRAVSLRSESSALVTLLGFPKCSFADIGSVFEHGPYHGTIPKCLSRSCFSPSFIEFSLHVTYRETVFADPFEYLLNGTGFLENDLVSGVSIAIMLSDILIAVGRTAGERSQIHAWRFAIFLVVNVQEFWRVRTQPSCLEPARASHLQGSLQSCD